METIHLLDQNTINKIAAGEVVERPSSVVKELVENAIDAKASAITIEIKGGGMQLIRITDNGSGIPATDVKTAFLRHSTSKLTCVEDLSSIHSLGFRGEALASIASVAQVEMITKTQQALLGVRFGIEGGVERFFEEIGCPDGTTLVIENLFFNTPARKKFLKSEATEASYVADFINKLALGNPHIAFKFINNGQIKLHTSGNNRLLDSVFSVFGKEIAKNVIELSAQDDTLQGKIVGFIGKPQISRANRTYENYFINGRYVKSKVIQRGIEDAFKTKLTLHQYPFTAFHIHVHPENVDVNVHPTKMEVRFNNEIAVYNWIYGTLSRALHQSELIPEVTFETKKEILEKQSIKQAPEPFEHNRIASQTSREPSAVMPISLQNKVTPPIPSTAISNPTISNPIISKPTTNHTPVDASSIQAIVDQAASKLFHTPIHTDQVVPEIIYKGEQATLPLQETGTDFFVNTHAKDHKIVGQLFKTYWIVEFGDKYYVVDQHAAHERVLYERILKDLEHHETMSQGLLSPVVLNLSMKEIERYKEYQAVFKQIGFEIEAFGQDALLMRGVPYIFAKPLQSNDFLMILDGLEDAYREETYALLLDDIAKMACKAAVKAHDTMSNMEYHQMIEDLFKLDNPFNCPHGRPTMIAMSQYELEKKFKRIQ